MAHVPKERVSKLELLLINSRFSGTKPTQEQLDAARKADKWADEWDTIMKELKPRLDEYERLRTDPSGSDTLYKHLAYSM